MTQTAFSVAPNGRRFATRPKTVSGEKCWQVEKSAGLRTGRITFVRAVVGEVRENPMKFAVGQPQKTASKPEFEMTDVHRRGRLTKVITAPAIFSAVSGAQMEQIPNTCSKP